MGSSENRGQAFRASLKAVRVFPFEDSSLLGKEKDVNTKHQVANKKPRKLKGFFFLKYLYTVLITNLRTDSVPYRFTENELCRRSAT